MSTRICYLVHDLSDPAVAKRLRMFAAGGAAVDVLGFNRAAAVPQLEAESVRELGRSEDARLAKRAVGVIRARRAARALAKTLGRPDVLVARNLEMLAVAHTVRNAMPGRPRLFYEVLDVHRLLVGGGVASRLLRALEARWLRECDGLILSSEAFHSAHFSRYPESGRRTLFVENKIDADIVPDGAAAPAIGAGSPWRIGWFGMIRCAKSLALLDEATRRMDGRLVVDIRGRVAQTAVPDFDAVVAANPFLKFGGAYDYRKDLQGMYANVHFAWAIDMFEEGLNSSWLLPNRLYESGAFGAVALALADVEVGRWLDAWGLGVRLGSPSAEQLVAMIDAMTPERLRHLRARYAAHPHSAWVWDAEDAARLVSGLGPAD